MKVWISLSSLLIVGCGSVNENPGVDASIEDAPSVDADIDAPPIACAETTCTNDTLTVCGTSGTIERTETCGLGCFTDGTRCNVIVPSNGLAASVDQAAQQGDITLPDGTQIDTTNGTVTSLQGTLAVATTTVAQPGGAMLRVFVAKRFTIGNVRVTGNLPLALVASSDIVVQGVLDVSADGPTKGPGAPTCVSGDGGLGTGGHFERTRAIEAEAGYPFYLWVVNGSGGGGFGTAGGDGGGTTLTTGQVGAAGIANGDPTLVPLRGGCQGNAEAATYRGAGGGAVQLVSNTRVHLLASGSSKGIIDAGGGGGRAGALGVEEGQSLSGGGSGGGGSGGGVLIEAPTFVLDDNTGVLAGGGGGGGYGACVPEPHGADATVGAIASGGACAAPVIRMSTGGGGATTANGTVGGAEGTAGGGSGGGGLGRIRVNTANGQFTAGASTIIRGSKTMGTVGTR